MIPEETLSTATEWITTEIRDDLLDLLSYEMDRMEYMRDVTGMMEMHMLCVTLFGASPVHSDRDHPTLSWISAETLGKLEATMLWISVELNLSSSTTSRFTSAFVLPMKGIEMVDVQRYSLDHLHVIRGSDLLACREEEEED